MNICCNCQTELSSYKLKCPRCDVRNVNYNNYKAAVVISLVLSSIAGILNQLTFPGIVSTSMVVTGVILITVIFFFVAGAGKDEDIQKVTIRLQGERLFDERGKFTFDEISLASGWKMDDTPASDIFKQRLFKVAEEEHWSVNNNVFSKNDKEINDNSK